MFCFATGYPINEKCWNQGNIDWCNNLLKHNPKKSFFGQRNYLVYDEKKEEWQVLALPFITRIVRYMTARIDCYACLKKTHRAVVAKHLSDKTIYDKLPEALRADKVFKDRIKAVWSTVTLSEEKSSTLQDVDKKNIPPDGAPGDNGSESDKERPLTESGSPPHIQVTRSPATPLQTGPEQMRAHTPPPENQAGEPYPAVPPSRRPSQLERAGTPSVSRHPSGENVNDYSIQPKESGPQGLPNSSAPSNPDSSTKPSPEQPEARKPSPPAHPPTHTSVSNAPPNSRSSSQHRNTSRGEPNQGLAPANEIKELPVN